MAFDTLNRLVIIHPNKRDGGIMKCFLEEESGDIHIGSECVLENCLNVIGKISSKFVLGDIDYTPCPNLPPISSIDIAVMRRHLSRNKAITFDGFTDSWFIKTERLDLLRDLWRADRLQ